MKKAYITNNAQTLFINPAKIVPEKIIKTIDTDIFEIGGKPVIKYKGEDAMVYLTKESYDNGYAILDSPPEVENFGVVSRGKGNIHDEKIKLSEIPEIVSLYEELLD